MDTDKRALLITNAPNPVVIGDTIAALPTAKALIDKGSIDAVLMTTESVIDLFDLGAPQYLFGTAEASEYETVLTLDTADVYGRYGRSNESLEALYAKAATDLGFDPGPILPSLDKVNAAPCPLAESDVPYVVLAPFSHSDLGTQTKLWPLERWKALIDRLKKEGLEIKVLGTVKENQIHCFTGNQLILNYPLDQVVTIMAGAMATVTVDNGMGWLARACRFTHVQILSCNMMPMFAFDNGPRAANVSDCRTASVEDVFGATMALINKESE